MTEKAKERALAALVVAGITAAVAVFLRLVWMFMWVCHYAGAPM